MICSKCKEEGRTSRVYGGGGFKTLMGWQPYYDEKGVLHSHDPNKETMGYKCSNGHVIKVEGYASCPNCDYAKDKSKVTVE